MARRGKRVAQPDPVIEPVADPVVDAPERAPTDPTLDPVDAPVEDAPPLDEAALLPALVAELDPNARTLVRNLGSRAWGGSDYAAVGPGSVPAGGVGVVTRRKADALVSGQYAGAGLGVGPFEIVEE